MSVWEAIPMIFSYKQFLHVLATVTKLSAHFVKFWLSTVVHITNFMFVLPLFKRGNSVEGALAPVKAIFESS